MKRALSVILTLLLLVGLCVPAFAAGSDPQQAADHLHSLGLFQGTGTSADGKPIYELNRAPSRDEAVTMLVRLLGKETEAKAGSWTTPFDDVDEWAKPYVGYAYSNGLTNGVDKTKFGSKSPTTATMYITFVLRALGYKDGVDFTWDAAWVVSDLLGITDGSYNAETNASFTRGGVAIISDNALEAKYKGGEQTLLQKLVADGAVTAGQPTPAPSPSPSPSPAPSPSLTGDHTELNSEQIYARCMPAVFYIEVYDEYGDAIGSGSGFFIDGNGTAVTNHHVIYGAASAKIMLADSAGADAEVRDVLGVYDWNEAEDWAVLKVDIAGNNWLRFGDSSTAQGGATVYTLGSPQGFSASIDDGMISNPARVIDGQTYIQHSASMSPGSSGGALVNKYGEVIGITNMILIEEYSQNINFAIPIEKIANARHGELTPINQTYTMPGGLIYTDVDYLELRPGETVDVEVTAQKYNTDALLTVVPYFWGDDEDEPSRNSDLIDLTYENWAADADHYTMHVTAGSSFGNTTLILSLETQDGDYLNYTSIYISVLGGAVAPEVEELTIDKGSSATVWIAAKADDGRSVKVRHDANNTDIISCSWGAWNETQDRIVLTVNGIVCGEYYLTLELLDANTEAVLATNYLYVNVVGGKLTISETEFMMAPGETKTVTISGVPNDPNVHASIYTDEYPSDVINWQRGALGANPAQLTITALTEGWDCIYITLCDAGGDVLADGWIDVYVNMDGREPATPLLLENSAMKAGMGDLIGADLDGNGVVDDVSLWLEPEASGGERVALNINGVDYSGAVSDLAEGFDCPDDAFWAITDLDAADGLLEIAIQDWGPSDDLTTSFFRFDGSRLFYLGSVEGFLYHTDGSGSVSMLGGGKISSYMRLSILQTWYAMVQYGLGADGRLAVIPQEFYTSTFLNQQTTLQRGVYAYDSPNPNGGSRVLSAGTTAQIVGTDNVQWVKLRLADGSECWLQMVGYGYDLESPDGLVPAWEALSDLLMAD